MKHASIPSPDESPEQDDELARYLLSVPPCPGIPVTEEETQAAVEASLADVAAGRFYDGEIVRRWIKTIAGPDFKPFDEWLAEQNV